MADKRRFCTGGSGAGASAQPAPACCAPRLQRGQSSADVRVDITEQRGDTSEQQRRRVSLAGERFLMGTDYPDGFLSDGEGPVRPIEFSPFDIDAFPVTNADFAAFVDATGYEQRLKGLGGPLCSGPIFRRRNTETLCRIPC